MKIKPQKIYAPLYHNKDKFIILVTGGRGSGKSFNVSTFIERLLFEVRHPSPAKRIVHQVLYTRYTMVSAHMSVIPEFMEKVELDGNMKYFRSTKTDVKNLRSGGGIFFRGIKTSSGVQTAKLKSIHGITTFVVDEAEEWVSEKEFETIMFSIRQKGIQNRIIIVMNPTDNNHWVYKRFIEKTHKLVEIDGVQVQISTHPNVLHIHTTYFDNTENLSPEFLKEVEEMKKNNPEKYAHVVIGRWADVAEGAIFKRIGIVKEFPANARKVALGLDFGFTHDPSAIIKCGIVDNDLYLDEICYKTDMLSSDLIKELRKENLFVYADCADPRLIQEIANGGIIIYPVQKGAGSIVAGIDRIKDFDNIFVTERSYNLIHEGRNYVWARDKDGNYINEPEDHDNHCFTGDTIVETSCGGKRIDCIEEGDYALTSDGFSRVNKVFDNGYKKILHIRLTFSNFVVEIKATPDHKIKTTKGWKQLQNLTKGDVLYTCKPLTVKSTSCMMENGISPVGVKDCIVKYGNRIMAKSPKAIIFITKMKTHGIMKLKTLNLSKVQNISGFMQKKTRTTPNSSIELKQTLTTQGHLQTNGINRRKGVNGIAGWLRSKLRIFSQRNISVNGAEKNLKRNPKAQTGFVPINVKQPFVIIRELTMKLGHVKLAVKNLFAINTVVPNIAVGSAVANIIPTLNGVSDLTPKTKNLYVKSVVKNIMEHQLERISIAAKNVVLNLRWKQKPVKYAGNNSERENIQMRDFVVSSVLENITVLGEKTERVYDLEVDKTHEYFANGILVHNCWDAVRYYTNGKILGKIVIPKNVNKSDLGIF